MSEQRSLFSEVELCDIRRSALRSRQEIAQEQMSVEALEHWKQRVFEYQQQVQQSLSPQQQGFFRDEMSLDPDSIDPYELRQQNTEFYRKHSDSGTAAVYFVIDYELLLLLYVGETAKSHQRWKGKHDCKDYLMNYREIHYRYQLPTAFGTAFYSQAPALAKSWRTLESALIHKWRSPFNKENAGYWNTPFLDN